jgi:hypothetical protein
VCGVTSIEYWSRAGINILIDNLRNQEEITERRAEDSITGNPDVTAAVHIDGQIHLSRAPQIETI